MSVAGTATIIGTHDQAFYDATLKPTDIPADVKGKRRGEPKVTMPPPISDASFLHSNDLVRLSFLLLIPISNLIWLPLD
jgi:hypothetical protein